MRALLRLTTLLLIVLMLLAAACASADKAAALAGKWAITGKLVTDSGNDKYAPKAGTIMHDSWTIGKANEGLALKTTKGTLPGVATASGAAFKATFPYVAGVYITVTIECFSKSAKSMYGTEEIVFTGTNSVTGALIPLGREAWTFTGKK
jgi:hypothetical protein